MCTLPVDVAVKPQDREAIDTHVPRADIHRRRRDDMMLHVMAQTGEPADEGTMHVKPVPTKLGQSYVLSRSHQTYGDHHCEPRTIRKGCTHKRNVKSSRSVKSFTCLPRRIWLGEVVSIGGKPHWATLGCCSCAWRPGWFCVPPGASQTMRIRRSTDLSSTSRCRPSLCNKSM